MVTYNGNLPQENGYADTWEEFFVNGFKHMLNMNISRGGPWDEMESLKLDMLNKVIPRLLRPMESNGRSIKPSLVHGDLWCGNADVDSQTDHPLIYDPASFYAHNECEICCFITPPPDFINKYQTSLEIGALKGINFPAATSMPIIRIFPSQLLRMTTMIETPCIPCASTYRLQPCFLKSQASESRE